MVLAVELANISDEDLLARVKRREYPAFVTLFDRYRPNAVTFAVRMLGDAEEAERIAGDAFCQLVRQAASFNAKKNSFRIWFFTTLRKLVSKQARASRTADARLERFTVLGHVADTGAVAAHADEARTLLKDLGRLKPVYREVVYLRRFEKMSYEEIAQVCGEKPTTIKSRMNYAVEQLRKGQREKG